jgi:hypothetical protein
LDVYERMIDFGIPLVLAALGVFLIYRGLNPRAWGRKCPGCRYDMRGTVGLKCPECGCVAGSEREVERGRISRRKVWAGAVLMLPFVWMAVFVCLVVPGPIFENRRYSQMKEGVETAAQGEAVEVVFRENPVAKLAGTPKDGVSTALFFCLRGVWSCFEGAWRTGDQMWEGAQSDYWLFGRESPGLMQTGMTRMNNGENWTLRWALFVAHQWAYPMRHYGRYSEKVREPWSAEITGAKVAETPTNTVPEALAERLGTIEELSELRLKNIVLSDAMVAVMVRMPNLRAVYFEGCEVSDGQLKALGANGRIYFVALLAMARPITSEMLMALSTWRKLSIVILTSARFTDLRVSDEAFAKLMASPDMREVSVSGRVRLGKAEMTAVEIRRRKVEIRGGVVFVFARDEVSPEVEAVFIKGPLATEVVEE